MNKSNSRNTVTALLLFKGCTLSLSVAVIAVCKHSVPLFWSLTLGFFSLLGIGLALALIAPVLRRARAYSKQVQQCGFLPPAPTDRAQRISVRLARFFSWLLVGKI